jgi:archaellum component FlaC
MVYCTPYIKNMKKSDSNDQLTKGMLDGAVDALLDAFEYRFNGIDKRFDGMDKRFDGIDKRLDHIETEIVFIKRDISDIKADLSITPSKREFNILKARVDKYCPVS